MFLLPSSCCFTPGSWARSTPWKWRKELSNCSVNLTAESWCGRFTTNCVHWLEHLGLLSTQLRCITHWLICHFIGGERVVTWRQQEARVSGPGDSVRDLNLHYFAEEFPSNVAYFKWRINFCSKCFSVAWMSDSPKWGWLATRQAPWEGTQDWPEHHFILFFVNFFLCCLQNHWWYDCF